MLAAMGDAHVKDMGQAVCGSSSRHTRWLVIWNYVKGRASCIFPGEWFIHWINTHRLIELPFTSRICHQCEIYPYIGHEMGPSSSRSPQAGETYTLSYTELGKSLLHVSMSCFTDYRIVSKKCANLTKRAPNFWLSTAVPQQLLDQSKLNLEDIKLRYLRVQGGSFIDSGQD